jgi:hypothetical protein
VLLPIDDSAPSGENWVCMGAQLREGMMSTDVLQTELKRIGKSGQLSLGKRYAGKTLRLERRADGTILLTSMVLVPESQMWTLKEPHRAAIARGMHWAATHPRRESDFDGMAKRALRRTGPLRAKHGSQR